MKIWWLERVLFFTCRPCSLMVARRWESLLGSFYNGTNPVHQGSTFKNCFIFQRASLLVPWHHCSEFQPKVCGRDTINFSQWCYLRGGIDDGFIFESPRHSDTRDISEQPVMSVHTLMWCVRRGNLCLLSSGALNFEVWKYEFLFHAFT